MRWLLYLRLFYLTAGTLLPFFWMIVILGHRRQRNFERIFFFLCLTLVCFFGSSLLALNAQLYYGAAARPLRMFAWSVLCLGLWFIPTLVVHLHADYAALRGLLRQGSARWIWWTVAYLPLVLLSPYLLAALRLTENQDFVRPTHVLGFAFQLWLGASVLLAAFWQWRFSKAAATPEERSLHTSLKWQFVVLTALLLMSAWMQRRFNSEMIAGIGPILLVFMICGPFLTILQQVNRFSFLAIGRQRNLIYAVSTMFVALLYLSFVRRAGQWLEPYLPPEASAALLLFLPVAFFEPLQRVIRGLLRQTAQNEVDRAQKLMGPINEVARLGDSEKLREFAERWIGEQLQLAEVKLDMAEANPVSRYEVATKTSSEEIFAIGWAARYEGRLRVRAHGAMISGETYAALEFVAEQLPAAFDLCHLIEEKLRLDRELAERERMALVGQMAASISHNLKNPLGSIKTILQVQMESAELPAALRGETQIVLDEINRLSAKLNQLLQFSRPGAPGENTDGRCDVREVISSVLNVLRPEAEKRKIRLGSRMADGEADVDASFEALHDVISNLVLNAIEASPPAGEVRVQLSRLGLPCVVSVEDEGDGIPVDMRDRVLRPFFTTKAHGTGLGLAIVAKRVAELRGELTIVSPVDGVRGTRFEVKLWPKVLRRNAAQTEIQVNFERSR